MTHPFKARRDWAPRALLVLCALCAGAVRADLLVTASGESLSGDLTRVKDGILVFRTSLEGQMMLPMSEVKSLATDGDWVVTELGGTVHVGRFVPDGIAETAAGEKGGNVTALALANVDSARPAIAPAGKAPEGAGWSGETGVGLRSFEGTRDGVAPELRLGLRRRGEPINTSLQLSLDADGQDSIPNHFRGSFELSESTRESWGPFVQALLERNTSEALEVRTGLSVGVRYRFDTPGDGWLEALAGVGASYGSWRGEYLAGDPRDANADRSELNLTLGLRYSRSIWGGAEWSSALSLTPSLTDADDFRAGASSSVLYPVTSRLHLRLEMLMNYEHDPALASLDGINTSVGASFELDF